MNEYIYILSNPSMPNLIKLGKTSTHPSQRMSGLHTTGVPTPFVLEFSALVKDCQFSEKAAHQALSKHREAANREFFRVSVKNALELILPKIGGYQVDFTKEAHGISEIQRKIDNCEKKEREVEQARLIAQEKEEQRRKTELIARRRMIEERIAAEKRKLLDLGTPPVKRELSALESFLSLCYLPLPFGVMVWFGASQIFDSEKEGIGIACIFLILAGFFCNKRDNDSQIAFDKAYAPLKEIESILFKLELELKKLPTGSSDLSLNNPPPSRNLSIPSPTKQPIGVTAAPKDNSPIDKTHFDTPIRPQNIPGSHKFIRRIDVNNSEFHWIDWVGWVALALAIVFGISGLNHGGSSITPRQTDQNPNQVIGLTHSPSGVNQQYNAPPPLSYQDQAIELRSAGRWGDLINLTYQWKDIEPGNENAWYLLGEGYLSLNNFPEALSAFRQVLRISPNHHDAWIMVTVTYIRAGQPKSARDIARKMKKVDPQLSKEIYRLMK